MNCNNCNTKVKSTDRFCENCGQSLEINSFNNQTKKTISTKISQTMLMIVTILSIILLLILLANYGKIPLFGLFFIIGVSSVIMGVGYYSVLFFISKSLDKKQKNSKLSKTIIIFFSFLPILYLLIAVVFEEIDVNKKSYTFENVSITFPEDFFKSTTTGYTGPNYNYVGFTKNSEDGYNQCIIGFEMNDYDKTYVEHFNERFAYRFGVDTYLNDISDMKSININEKEWKFYETIDNDKYYKMYSIKIDEYIYLIDIEDRKISDPICNERVQEILKTIKYKK